MAAAPNIDADTFSEILDLGREKLSEGTFIKLANFLRDVHNEQTRNVEEIALTRITPIKVHVEFDTYNGKHYTIIVDNEKIEYMRGSTPNREYVSGSVNGIAFIDRVESEFIGYLERFKKFYGMKNIVRKMDEHEEESFATFGKFCRYMREREVDDSYDSNDEDDECHYQDSWVIRNIFGLTC
jgi:hypothetical protein